LSIKAVLIDHDGTIVDSEFSHFQMWMTVLKPYDVRLTEADYKKYYAGMPTPANAVDMIQRFSLNASVEKLIHEKTVVTQAFLSNSAFPPLNGALEFIEAMHTQGLKLAIVTGANQMGLNRTVQAYGLDNYVSALVSSDDVIHSKPAPDCYLLAMEKLGVLADECLAIEDTEHGIRAATGAGIRCLAIPTEMSRHHNFSAATRVFDDISETGNWIMERMHAPV